MSIACPSGDTDRQCNPNSYHTLLPSLSKYKSDWWSVSSLENLAKSFLFSNTNAGILLKVSAARLSDKARDPLGFVTGWKMTSSSLFSFHFLPAFLSGSDTCRYNGWYVICAHAGWIKFLMAPRAVVLAVKNCCNSVKEGYCEYISVLPSKDCLTPAPQQFCNFLMLLQIIMLSVWTQDQQSRGCIR